MSVLRDLIWDIQGSNGEQRVVSACRKSFMLPWSDTMPEPELPFEPLCMIAGSSPNVGSGEFNRKVLGSLHCFSGLIGFRIDSIFILDDDGDNSECMSSFEESEWRIFDEFGDKIESTCLEESE